MAPSRMLVLQDQEWLSVWEKCSFAHRQVDEQPTKRSKKNDDLNIDHLMHDNWVVYSRHEAAEVYSTEELRHAETNPT